MEKSQLTKGFVVNTTITGVPVAVVPKKEGAKKPGAKLQFATINDKGLQTIDVKIEAAHEDDLKKYINQYIVIDCVNVSKVEFNTFYSCADKSLISINKGA